MGEKDQRKAKAGLPVKKIRSIRRRTVFDTWKGILNQEDKLLDNWMEASGVLVGIRLWQQQEEEDGRYKLNHSNTPPKKKMLHLSKERLSTRLIGIVQGQSHKHGIHENFNDQGALQIACRKANLNFTQQAFNMFSTLAGVSRASSETLFLGKTSENRVSD
ncbi:hypothetical protein C8R44DRAFT_728438 [Mycena epipterygia]|nr:hypothetical protein C8R44DRAFT_728438 [Mycena epipterygia]